MKTATSPAINKPSVTPTHEHTYSNVYMYDEEYHWYPATCGHPDAKKQKEKHNFGNWTIEKDSTVFEEGRMVRSCQNCTFKEYTIIEKKSNKGLAIDNPYSVLEAISIFTSLNDYTVTDKPYYVTGKVESASKNSNGYTLFFEENSYTIFSVQKISCSTIRYI